jgi:predicted ribosomally synthesized peptide with SipW-like signal peptide
MPTAETEKLVAAAEELAARLSMPESIHPWVAVFVVSHRHTPIRLMLPSGKVMLALPASTGRVLELSITSRQSRVPRHPSSPRSRQRSRSPVRRSVALASALLITVVVGGSPPVGTFAAWSDSRVIPGNVVTAGVWGPTEIEIDIKVGSDPNSINLGSNGVLPVTVLSSTDDPAFDPASLNWSTVRFGAPDAPPAGAQRRPSLDSDVNDDNVKDATYHFRTQETGLTEEDSQACLTGTTIDGVEGHRVRGDSRGAAAERG